MSLWDKDNEHSGQDRRDERPDLSFEMPENIRKLNSDVSWADREEDAGDKAVPPQEPILELSEELGADAGVPAGGSDGAAVKPRFLDRAMRVIGHVVPKRGDPPLESVRKCIFFIALLTLIGSAAYIVNDMVIIPHMNEMEYISVRGLYDPENPVPLPDGYENYEFPEGMSDAFKPLYIKNNEIRGWLDYSSNGSDWLDISYPVMYSGDNEKYLTKDFYNTENKNGALFFDEHNNLETPDAQNKSLIIYGHNMASQQMFAKLNQFISNVEKVKSAPTIKLDTLYQQSEYKVFAIMIINNQESDGPRFDYIRTGFNGDEDFMDHVANIRARSMYDFPVDVEPTDDLLILSTCTAYSGAKFNDGRLAVVARRVRPDESAAVDVNAIVKNEDVIMPLAWYLNQDMEAHPFYTDPTYQIENNWRPPVDPNTTLWTRETYGPMTTITFTTAAPTTTGGNPPPTQTPPPGTTTRPTTTPPDTTTSRPTTTEPPATTTTTTTTTSTTTTTTTTTTTVPTEPEPTEQTPQDNEPVENGE